MEGFNLQKKEFVSGKFWPLINIRMRRRRFDKEIKNVNLTIINLSLRNEAFSSEEREMKESMEGILLPFQALCVHNGLMIEK